MRAAIGIYELCGREAGFYNTVSREVCLNVPRLYFSAANADRGQSVLLLEDFRDAQPIDVQKGLSVAEALFVVGELARFHASWWQSPRLASFEWLPLFSHYAAHQSKLLSQYSAAFRAKMGDLVPPEFISMGDAIFRNFAWINDELSREPTTFLHGDFHTNNMFLDKLGEKYELKVFDWQICSRGCAARDLMYFIANGMTREERRKHEPALIREYHQKLIAHGVRNYSMDECMRGYRVSVLDLYSFTVTVLAVLDFTTSEEAISARDRIVDRWIGIILDHQPIDLLPRSCSSAMVS